MKILLTGATGYIGKRVLPILASLGHEVICGVRDKKRFNSAFNNVSCIEIDLLNPTTLSNIPVDIDAAYYLIHSMSNNDEYHQIEEACAKNFVWAINKTNIKQVI